MSMASVPAAVSGRVSCSSRRVSECIVVSRSCNGFISPRPLNRCTLTLPLPPASFSRLRVAFFSCSSMA